MNDQELIAALYPDPSPLTDLDRATMRDELFGTSAASATGPMPHERRAIRDADAGVVNEVEIEIGNGSVVATRRWPATVAAAVVVSAGIAGVWAVAGQFGDEASPPAQQPNTAPTEATDATTAGTHPTLPSAYPLLADVPEGHTVTARLGPIDTGRDRAWTQALIGRDTDGVLTDAIVLAVHSEPAEIVPKLGRTPTETVVMGQPAVVHDESYSSRPLYTVTWGSGPYFVAQGEDPMTFLSQATPDTMAAIASPEADHPPTLTIGALPDDLDVIVPPHAVSGDDDSATLSIAPAGHQITVSTTSPLLAMAMTSASDPPRSVDINGRPGWASDSPESTPHIAWQVDESTFASIVMGDGSNASDALELAASITFVDFETWATRYPPD